jgi:hypothetical protein
MRLLLVYGRGEKSVLNWVQREKPEGRLAYQSKFERCDIERGILRGGCWILASKVGAGSSVFKVLGEEDTEMR